MRNLGLNGKKLGKQVTALREIFRQNAECGIGFGGGKAKAGAVRLSGAMRSSPAFLDLRARLLNVENS